MRQYFSRFNIIISIYIILLTGSSAFSQSIEVFGRIQSVDGNVIPYANVSLITSKTDSLFISSQQSSIDGNFKIFANKYSNLLVVNSFGYKRKIIEINQTYPLIVTLQAESIKLNEVIVKANLPIIIKKDTSAFNVKSFSDKTETSIEEIIKKLPGMTVSSNGTIFFNGRAIDKILINGEDFFSKNYKLLSKNISPKMVAVIEAITNYNDQPLLSSVNPSEKSVLNLKLENENNVKIVSENKVGLGISNRFLINTTNFAFFKKIKVGIIGNANNTNQDVLADASENIFLENHLFANKNIDIRLPINNTRPYVPSLSEARYLDKFSKLAAIQLNKTFNDIFKIKFYSYIYNEKYKNNFSSENNFVYGDSVNRISSYGLNNSNLVSSITNLNAELRINTNSSLAINTSVNVRKHFINNYFELNNNLQKDFVKANSVEPIRGIDMQISYTKKINSNSALLLTGSFYRNNSNQALYLSSPLYKSIINSSNANDLIQNFNIYQSNITSKIEYFTVLKLHHLSVAASVNNYSSNVNSSLSNQIIYYHNYKNDLVYKDSYKELEVKDIFENNLCKVTASFNLHNGDILFNDTSVVNKNVLFVRPYLSIKSKFSNVHKIDLELSYNNQQSGPTDLFRNFVFEDYINANKNSPEFNTMHRVKGFLNYSYLNKDTYLNASINAICNINYNQYALYYRPKEFVNLTTRIPFSGKNSDFTVRSTIGKLLHGVKTRVQFTNTLSYYAINRLSINDIPFTSIVYNYEVGTSVVTPLKHNFAVGFEPNYVYRYLINEGADKSFNINQFRINSFINAEPIPELVIKMVSENIIWNNKLNTFVDAILSYSFKKERNYSIEFRATNLLNNKEINFSTLSTNLLSSNSYSITPRIVYVALKFGI